jgi:hypothetical protein
VFSYQGAEQLRGTSNMYPYIAGYPHFTGSSTGTLDNANMTHHIRRQIEDRNHLDKKKIGTI